MLVEVKLQLSRFVEILGSHFETILTRQLAINRPHSAFLPAQPVIEVLYAAAAFLMERASILQLTTFHKASCEAIRREDTTEVEVSSLHYHL